MLFGKWKKQKEINDHIGRQLAVFDTSLKSSFSNVDKDVVHLKQWIHYLHSHQDRLSASVSKVDARLKALHQQIGTLLSRDEIKAYIDEYYKYADHLNKAIIDMKSNVDNKITAIQSSHRDIFHELSALSSRTSSLRKELSEEIVVSEDRIMEQSKQLLSQKLSDIPDKSAVFDKLESLNLRIDDLYSKALQKPLSLVQSGQDFPKDPSPKSLPSLPVATNYANQQAPLPSQTRNNLREKIIRRVARHSKEYVKSMLVSLIKKYGRVSGLNLREIVVEEQGIVSKSSFYRLLIEIEEEDAIHVIQDGKEKHYVWTLSNSPLSG
jgi:hypothetical protein